MFRPLLFILIGTIAAPRLFSSPLPHPRDSSLDSTDRATYVYSGDPVFFGPQSNSAVISVPDMYILNDVDVILTIEHTYDSDVRVTLISPAGTSVCLIRSVGSNGDGFTNTYLNDAATLPLTQGSAPFTGSFRPVEPLSGFNGGPGQGTWQLLLEDTYPNTDDGSLIAWTLILGGRIGGAVRGQVTAFENSDPLAGVIVSAVGTSYTAMSDQFGRFILTLPPGRFVVQCSCPERCAERTDTVQLALSDTLTRDFALRRRVFKSSHTSLNLTAFKDQLSLDSLMVTNPGDCDLTFEAATETDWLALLPREDVVGAGDSTIVRIFVSTMDLTPGDYIGSINFTHNAAGNLFTIPVFLSVLHSSGIEEMSVEPPRHCYLADSYPNPFNSTSIIRFALPKRSAVRLELYNALGQKVKTLVDGWTEAGFHAITLDGTGMASGTYLLRLTAGDFSGFRRLVLLK